MLSRQLEHQAGGNTVPHANVKHPGASFPQVNCTRARIALTPDYFFQLGEGLQFLSMIRRRLWSEEQLAPSSLSDRAGLKFVGSRAANAASSQLAQEAASGWTTPNRRSGCTVLRTWWWRRGPKRAQRSRRPGGGSRMRRLAAGSEGGGVEEFPLRA